MHQWTRSALVQIMACCRICDKALSKQMLVYCGFNPSWSSFQWFFFTEIQNVSFTKMHRKISSTKQRPCFPGGIDLIIGMPSVSLQILILGDVYLLEKTGCIDKLYNPQETANYYVEITLSGCKYLCEFLHDLTCTLLVWIPSQRSCILQPLLATSLLHEANPCNGCLYAEILHRQRKTGHCYDVIMSSIASQITSLTIVYSTVYSGTDERKHQCSASLAFVRGIHR